MISKGEWHKGCNLTRLVESSITLETSLPNFRPSSVHHLLEQVLDLTKRRDAGEALHVPTVILQLVSGREIRGEITDMIRGTSVGTTVVLKTRTESGENRLLYTDLEKIETVSFTKLERPSKRLKKETVAPPKKEATAPPKKGSNPFVAEEPKGEAVFALDGPSHPSLKLSNAPPLKPGTLRAIPALEKREDGMEAVSDIEIQKLVMSLNSLFSMLFDSTITVEIGWSSIPKSKSTLSNLKKLVVNTRLAFTDLVNLSEKKEEMRNLVKSIRFCHGSSFDMRLEGECLLVMAPLNESREKIPVPSNIQSTLNSKLF